MTAFDDNLSFEQRFTDRFSRALRPVLEGRGWFLARHGRTPESTAVAVDVDIQRRAGDFSVLDGGSGLLSFRSDLKVQRRSSPNLFFETHSNYVLDPRWHAPGWGITLEVERIWYAFEDSGLVAGLDLRELRTFLGEEVTVGSGRLPRLEGFRGVIQSRYRQPNVTFGRLVPWKAVPPSVWRRCMFLKGDDVCELTDRDRFLGELQAFLDGREVVGLAA